MQQTTHDQDICYLGHELSVAYLFIYLFANESHTKRILSLNLRRLVPLRALIINIALLIC